MCVCVCLYWNKMSYITLHECAKHSPLKKSTDRKRISHPHHKLIAVLPYPSTRFTLNDFIRRTLSLWMGNFSLIIIIIIIILWCMMCHILSNEWKIELILLRFSRTLSFPLIIFMVTQDRVTHFDEKSLVEL